MGLQHQYARNSLWASYSAGQVEYSFPTLESAAFPASHDQTHEFKVVESVRLAARWSVGSAWVVASGRPETPAEGVESVWFPTGESIYQVAFEEKNSSRLPVYHRLDLSTQFDVKLGAFGAQLGATAFNVYDRKNISFRQYEAASTSLTTKDITLMGRAVNIFVRFGF